MTVKQLLKCNIQSYIWGYNIEYSYKNLLSVLGCNTSDIVRISNGLYDNTILNSEGKLIYGKNHLEENV